jgi:hypothetical protein
MSRFYNEAVNGRGNVVGIGGRGSAGQTHLRGWNAGVKVVPVGIKGEPDRFEVYMTSGSHASARDVLLGTVHATSDGPKFAPVNAILGLDNAPSWVMHEMTEDAADSASTSLYTPNHP